MENKCVCTCNVWCNKTSNGPAVIVNIKLSTKHTLLREGGSMVKKKHWFCTLSTGKLSIRKIVMCTLFKGGGASEKVCFIYTHWNVDNYGRPLKQYGKQICVCTYNVWYSKRQQNYYNYYDRSVKGRFEFYVIECKIMWKYILVYTMLNYKETNHVKWNSLDPLE